MAREYALTTKDDYKVVATYGSLNNSYTIIKRSAGDYVVAYNYNVNNGMWAQGHYSFSGEQEAEEWIARHSKLSYKYRILMYMDVIVRELMEDEERIDYWCQYGIPDGIWRHNGYLEYLEHYNDICEAFRAVFANN